MTSADRPLLSIVVPVYNESEVIGQTYARLTAVVRAVPGFDYEIIAVDDGSSDGSYAAMVALASSDRHFRVLKLSRNFGHQTAITAGMDVARGDCVVLIDADLQDPPEVIPQMVAKWREGFDVVYAVRTRREGDGLFKRASAALFYRMMRLMVGIDLPVDTGDFRLTSRRVVLALRALRETHRFVRGFVVWVGFKQTSVTFVRAGRFAGTTKYPLRKMLRFAVDGITSFSIVPLRFSSFLSAISGLIALGIAFWAGWVHFFVNGVVPGWTSIVIAITLVSAAQFLMIGILGEYVGRIYEEVKRRPLYVVRDEQNVEKEQDP
jgi:polyisoprenyl-phosphate glycosyltransferase